MCVCCDVRGVVMCFLCVCIVGVVLCIVFC